MQKNAAPYLIFKKTKHWTSQSFSWQMATPLEVSRAVEFLERHKISDPLKISFDLLDDYCANFGVPDCRFFIEELMIDMNNTLKHDQYVVFNFREVFLLKDGIPPPPHYRAGIDVCVHTLEEYRQAVSKFSYQLAKTFFNHCPRQDLERNPHQIDIRPYANVHRSPSGGLSPFINQLEKPLNQLPSFSGYLEAFYFRSLHINLKGYFYDYINPQPANIMGFNVVSFGPGITAEGLKSFFLTYPFSNQEVTIILRGTHYHDPIERQCIEEMMLKVMDFKTRQLVQLILLTDENTTHSLKTLAPEITRSMGSYIELAHGAGYYLSSPRVFSLIYRAIRSEPGRLEALYNPIQTKALTPSLQHKAYLYRQGDPIDSRCTKYFNRQDLKANVRLSLTHEIGHQVVQQAVQQESIGAIQTQQHTEALRATQSEAIQNDSSWFFVSNFEVFCRSLSEHYENINGTPSPEQTTFFTQHYQTIQREFNGRLATDHAFLIKIAAGIFGLAYASWDPDNSTTNLPNYSADVITECLMHELVPNIVNFRDGVNPKSRKIGSSFFQERALVDIEFENEDLMRHRFPCDRVSWLSFHNTETHGYQGHLNYYVLLNQGVLESQPKDRQIALMNLAESLLSLFKLGVVCEEASAFEGLFLELIELYFKDNLDYLRVLKRFMSMFEAHHGDNLKIMLQVLIQDGLSAMAEFLNLLIYLESRCVLEQFYKIHFKYAQSVFSVVELINNPEKALFEYRVPIILGQQDRRSKENCLLKVRSSAFVSLIARTPAVATFNDLPSFEKLCYHFLVFAARHNMPFFSRQFEKFERLWRRLYSKVFLYTGSDIRATDALMGRLATQLMDEEGLSIAPLGSSETFFGVLEQLIDHAISKGMLEEQIEELGYGLSFAWMDVPYAIAYNGFYVVSSEMGLQSERINSVNKGYSVSFEGLHHLLMNCNDEVIRSTFCYLGTEKRREDLKFYRHILNIVLRQGNPTSEEIIIYETVFAYFVLMTTGVHYSEKIDEAQFRQEFIAFWKRYKSKHSVPEPTFLFCLNHFLEASHKAPQDAQQGITTLWRLWLIENPSIVRVVDPIIPDVLTQKFEQAQLLRFIALHSDAIQRCDCFIEKDSRLVYALIQAQSGVASRADFKKTCIALLRSIYPDLTMAIFIRDIVKIDTLIERYNGLVGHGARGRIFVGLNPIFSQWKSIDLSLNLITLLNDCCSKNNTSDCLAGCAEFLGALAHQPLLLSNLSVTADLLALVLDAYVKSRRDEARLHQCFTFCERLMEIQPEEASRVLALLLTQTKLTDIAHFFEVHSLTPLQLCAITDLLQSVNDPLEVLPIIQLSLEQNAASDVSQLRALLNNGQQRPILGLCILGPMLSRAAQMSVESALERLKQLPEPTLDALLRLKMLHPLGIDDFLMILNSASILDRIKAYERQAYAQNLERYAYDEAEIINKISLIKRKSHTHDEVVALAPEDQQQLLKDYVQLMSYMLTRPIFVECNEAGIQQAFTIHELNEIQFQALYRRLSQKLINKDQQHGHELMLLALSCEALYRTTKKFPRSIQILCILNSLSQGGHLISEMKTGQGKSIVAALMAVLLCASGRTVDVVTENMQLAKDGLKGFRLFYDYLGLSCGEGIITPDSPYEAYVSHGINYSTAAGLALFRVQMELEKKSLPENISLVADEIDAALTTTVQYRLATTLNPLSRNTAVWAVIYDILLNFVKEQDLFLKNKCSKSDDIENARSYLLLNSPKKDLSNVLAELSDEALGELIDCALVAHELEENIDYMVVTIEKDKTFYYAAPILDSTKRPDAKVSFSDGLQQLLHTRLNRTKANRKFVFDIEPCGETLVVISAKNFFDSYRLKGGRIIGFTGTAGTRVELHEFYQYNGLTAYCYPTHAPDQSVDLGLFWAFGPEAHQLKLLEQITIFKSQVNLQPILIITNSAKATETLTGYLTQHTHWIIQSYNGYAGVGYSEEEVIHQAGQAGVITVANESLARGTDFLARHEAGLLVINACKDITESDLLQIQGRTGRNGQVGQYCSIIDATGLGDASSAVEEIAANFKIHRNRIAISKQEARFKTRLLEDVRYHIVSHYFLRLWNYADKLLSPQLGFNQGLLSSTAFLTDLRDFNLGAERHHDAASTDALIAGCIEDYQAALNRWIPEGRFQTIHIIEPLIPLENLAPLRSLDAVKLSQVEIMSALLSTGWKYAGHQQMQLNFEKVDQLLKHFDGYFNETCSFRHALVNYLGQEKILDIETMHNALTEIEKQLMVFTEGFRAIPLLGHLIPIKKIQRFLSDYFKLTHEQVEAKQWDEITLPKVDISSITYWLNAISTAMTVGSIVAAGPIPFIVNRILIPAISPWIKSWMRGSGVSSLEILSGIADITTDLSQALIALSSLPNQREMTLGFLCDSISPLLNNRAFLKIASLLLESSNQKHLIPYLETIPTLLKVIEPYQHRPFREFLTVETALYLFQRGSQFEAFKKRVEKTEFKHVLPRILELHPDFIAAFRDVSFRDFLGFVKVISHPRFFDFIKQLPEQSTFAELLHWLNQAVDAVPEEIRPALIELRSYQTNHERIAEHIKLSILRLRDNFDLTDFKLKAGLDRLAVNTPIIPTALPVIDAKKTDWFKYSMVFSALVILILFNVFYFSMVGALTSLVLLGWGINKLLPNRSTLNNPREILLIIEPPLEPIQVRVVTEMPPQPEARLREAVSQAPIIKGIGYRQQGLFGSSKAAEALPNLNLMHDEAQVPRLY